MNVIRIVLLSVAVGLSMQQIVLPKDMPIVSDTSLVATKPTLEVVVKPTVALPAMSEQDVINKVIDIYLDLPKAERKALLAFYKANQAMIGKIKSAMTDFKSITSAEGIGPAMEKHRLAAEDIKKISDFIRSDIGMSIVKIVYTHIKVEDQKRIAALIKSHAAIAIVAIKEISKHISEQDRQDLFKLLGLKSIDTMSVETVTTTVDTVTFLN